MLPPRRMAQLSAVLIAAASFAVLPIAAGAADTHPGNGGDARGAAPKALTGTATCPAGKVAIAGGYSSPAGSDITANYRSAPDTWTVQDPYTTPTDVYVVCSKNIDPTVVEVTGDAPAAVGDHLALTARCPSGSIPISGGWAYGDDNTENSPVYTSRPVRRGWKVRAFFNQRPSTLTAFAYCAPRASRSVVVTASGEPVGDDGTPATADVVCPGGHRVLGGGFNTAPKSDYYNDEGPDFFYYQSQPSERSAWQVQATNYGQSGYATAYATCSS